MLRNIGIVCNLLGPGCEIPHPVHFQLFHIFLCPAVFQLFLILLLFCLCTLIFCQGFRILFLQPLDLFFRQRTSAFQLGINLAVAVRFPDLVHLILIILPFPLFCSQFLILFLSGCHICLFLLPFLIQHLQLHLAAYGSCKHISPSLSLCCSSFQASALNVGMASSTSCNGLQPVRSKSSSVSISFSSDSLKGFFVCFFFAFSASSMVFGSLL